MAGEARALLAKAEVVAREAGVAHDSLAMTSDRPHEAILDAAEARGCDLIFMASHGRRGVKNLMLGSQTQKVLQHATIPVLVSAVESNVVAPAYVAPAAIIRDEHRSLAAVIHGLEYLIRDARDTENAAAVPAAARDAVLHQRLSREAAPPEGRRVPVPQAARSARRSSTTRSTSSSASTSTGHRARRRARSEPRRATRPIPPAASPSSPRPSSASRRRRWQHMNLETEGDHAGGAEAPHRRGLGRDRQAFAENGDPRFSVDADEEFRQLFARILNLAPEHVVGSAGR